MRPSPSPPRRLVYGDKNMRTFEPASSSLHNHEVNERERANHARKEGGEEGKKIYDPVYRRVYRYILFRARALTSAIPPPPPPPPETSSS